ncbi:iron complex outermembrane receptor protein [Nonlabens dokdonensis]|uniref:TonB-dependent outer membrane protein n=2 Tax=Nonlabens dokdonensis TaxID=328515 RepID=L7W7D1_NONDD|nr:SusC/RagA family TonB-linked outer membrane protein [Nonlabens dokdonensis]AGC76112.1 TonB-dependent outer membrane protein [Nonlabens dokdonensis DSW-6]PZX43783.1 iron complex outermembrane receptor protein [Nonlabens dokdonensis]
MNQKFKAVLLLFLLPFFAFAQSVITGTVLESNGLPALGATVAVKGTSNGTSTDFDGNYTLNNVPEDAVIVFSFVGYVTQEIPYTGQSTINITLEEDASELETIVLIGYGSIKKENVTAAQTTVSDEEFNKGAITSPGQLLAGKAAGVQVTAASGRPGDGPVIRVRPGSTLSGNSDALYVVDGVPLDQRNANLNSINPADIESFTILKDASATAIYGNRASNGVVLITTKKAKLNSDLKVSYNVQFAVEQVDNYTEVLTGDEFRQLVADQGRDTSILGTANTDWQNEIYQNGTRSIHSLVLEKGYETTSIRASLGYNNENGILQKSGYERANLGLNIRQNFLKGDLRLTFTSQLAQEERRFADEGAIGSAVVFDPTQSIFNNTGEFGGFFEYTNNTGPEPNAPRNPLGLLNSLDAQQDNVQARLNMNAAYNIRQVPGLKFTGNAGFDYNEYDGYSIRDRDSGAGFRGNNRSFNEGFRRNQLLDGKFDYKKTLETFKTDMTLTLGGSYQEFLRQDTGRFSANNELQESPINIDESALVTAFARASFDINDLYVLSASASRNGSSRFSENNRWANFYGASGAIKLTNTDFVQNSGFLSQLKLRGGFGQTGQQDIDASFAFLSVFTPGQPQAAVQFGNEFVTTIRPEGAIDLKWETTDQWNAGIDLGFFGDRITGSVDAFYRETSDLLLFGPLPAGGLENGSLQNAGSTLSRGIETTIAAKIIQSENINWTVSGNATVQEIEITDLAGAENAPVQVGGISGGVGNNIQEWAVGADPTSFHVFRQVYDQDGNPLDGVYVDTNGDNILNDADRVRYKKANHDVYFGFTSNFNYKNFDMSFTFRGAAGGYNYNNIASNAANFGSTFPTNTQNPLYLNAPVDIQNTNFSQQRFFSDYYVQKADFIKLDNLSLGYNFPGDKVDIRASVTGTNLFTITDYEGVDPEVFGGIDNNLFPRTRGVIFGLGFNF